MGATASFPIGDVKRVRIGRGWAQRGMWLLILPYVAGINSMAEGYCVSFEAPDGETGQDVVYALHMRSTEDAPKLAAFLEGRGFSVPTAQPQSTRPEPTSQGWIFWRQAAKQIFDLSYRVGHLVASSFSSWSRCPVRSESS